MRAAPVLCIAALALSGCDRADMVAQPKAGTWDKSTVFADQTVMRPPVPGTEARNPPDLPVPQPTEITLRMVTRGAERYDIVCAPCHGRDGMGRGMIVLRGFPPPPSLTDDNLVKATAAYLADVIANGHGTMAAYAAQVAPADRWAIVAYIRALQFSHNAPAAMLTGIDRTALERAP